MFETGHIPPTSHMMGVPDLFGGITPPSPTGGAPGRKRPPSSSITPETVAGSRGVTALPGALLVPHPGTETLGVFELGDGIGDDHAETRVGHRHV